MGFKIDIGALGKAFPEHIGLPFTITGVGGGATSRKVARLIPNGVFGISH